MNNIRAGYTIRNIHQASQKIRNNHQTCPPGKFHRAAFYVNIFVFTSKVKASCATEFVFSFLHFFLFSSTLTMKFFYCLLLVFGVAIVHCHDIAQGTSGGKP